MTDRYSNIKTGTEISKESLIIDSNIINNYLNAINDSSRVKLNELEKNFIPPMCIAALSLRGVTNKEGKNIMYGKSNIMLPHNDKE